MVARSLHSAEIQACSRPRVRIADACLSAVILSHRSDETCYPRTVTSQKTDYSAMGLLALFPLERDLVGTAKRPYANSP